MNTQGFSMKITSIPLIAISTCLLTIASANADDLAEIYNLAVKNDATLKSAEASFRANSETEKQALSALLPNVTASASRTKTDADSTGFSRDSLTQDPVTSSVDNTSEKWGATLTQTLFDLSAWYTFKSGKETSKQAEADLAASQQDLIIRVSDAYFNVLRNLENLQASKAEERANKRQLEQTQQRFDVGLIAITDVHEARASYDLAVVQRLTDEGNLGTAYEALTVLTGQTHSNLLLLNPDYAVVPPVPSTRDEWVQFALKNNYSLKSATYRAESAHNTAKSSRMNHAPTISAVVSYEDSDTDGTNTIDNFNTFPTDSDGEATVWSINLEVPIFSGGRISSQRKQSYEQFNAAKQDEINTRRTVIQNTRSLHLNVMTDVQRVKARAQTIVSTRSALEATQAGYEVGTRNVVDVLVAQRALYNAIRDYANSRYDYIINMLSLKEQAGTLSPQDIYDLNKWLIEGEAPTASEYQNL